MKLHQDRLKVKHDMDIPATLQKKIVDFLISLPNIHDGESQQAFVINAGLDAKLQTQLVFGRSPKDFIPILVFKLIHYGTLHNGQYAIEAILEAAKNYVGENRQVYCETLIQEFHKNIAEILDRTAPQPLVNQQLLEGHHFICYAPTDGIDFALELYDALVVEKIPVWLDRYDIQDFGMSWDDQVSEAIKTCSSILFISTADSVQSHSACITDWIRALKYKKPIIPIVVDYQVELPYRLAHRQAIDFSGDASQSINEILKDKLRQLCQYLYYLTTPSGKLQQLKDRRVDAEHDLRRTEDSIQYSRITNEISRLDNEIELLQKIVEDPQAAAKRTQESIKRGIERERQPEKPVIDRIYSKFINPPPTVAPTYFQDRHVETKLVADFLNDRAKDLIIVAGRAGIGKTAMVCRLLKFLEIGQLSDEFITLLPIDGIIYLSAAGTHRVNFPNIYGDLCKLLPQEDSGELQKLYQNSQISIQAKIQSLLESIESRICPERGKKIVVLLDNFEDIINSDTQSINDAELDEALKVILSLPYHTLKIIITTRVVPRDLMLFRPERQQILHFDEGLESPYAENILREMDKNGTIGLKNASEESLKEAKERTRGYPRALEALFAILAADRATTLDDILADTQKLLPDNVVEVLVGEAFNRLEATAQMVMQALSVYTRPVSSTAIDYLLEPHFHEIDCVPILNRLVNMQFVRKEAGNYYLHPVDRTYAFARIPEGGSEDLKKGIQETPPFSQFALRYRGAEYFRQIRHPRESWETLNDLIPQLAEFELRFSIKDYNTSAKILETITFDYLLSWGHYRLSIRSHELLHGNIEDLELRKNNLNNLGLSYALAGQNKQATSCLEQALSLARDGKDRYGESTYLGNLGNRYAEAGKIQDAIECYSQALAIERDLGYQRGEGVSLCCLGNRYSDLAQTNRAMDYYKEALPIVQKLGDHYTESFILENMGRTLVLQNHFAEAIQRCQQAIHVADKIKLSTEQQSARYYLAVAHLCINDLCAARIAAEASQEYDEPRCNQNTMVLLGIIFLRQGSLSDAKEKFAATIEYVDSTLGGEERNYLALYSKGLALCGLALCDEQQTEQFLSYAKEVYLAARTITSADGIVKEALQLLSSLSIADHKGILNMIPQVIKGE